MNPVAARATAVSAPGLTQALAGFVARLPEHPLPAQVQQAAWCALRDCIGVGLAGAQDSVTDIAARTLATTAGACTVWGRTQAAAAADAALINGCAAHAHALDDTQASMRGHPSAPIVPAILALGQVLDASGDALVQAYVAGVQVAGRLGRSVNDRHAQLGWHTTGTLGTIGAAAACASLLRLDEIGIAHALGISAAMAGGLRVNFGTMTKALVAGLAAHHGVLAAQLAANGMQASPVALEGYEGFLSLFCDDGSADAERALQGLDTVFEVLEPGIVYKRYPTCSLLHALTDLVLQAQAQGCFAPGARLELVCTISQRHDALRERAWPRTGLTAKFHVEYCVALAALRGTQGIADFTDAAVQCPQVRALAQAIYVEVGRDFPADNGDCAALRVMRDGTEVFHQRQERAIGHPSMPLSQAQHQEKFMQCATAAFTPIRAAALWHLLSTPVRCSARALADALALASEESPKNLSV